MLLGTGGRAARPASRKGRMTDEKTGEEMGKAAACLRGGAAGGTSGRCPAVRAAGTGTRTAADIPVAVIAAAGYNPAPLGVQSQRIRIILAGQLRNPVGISAVRVPSIEGISASGWSR